MVHESSVVCKVCSLGKIIIITETHYRYRPISWYKHFFEKRPYWERLVRPTFWKWLSRRELVREATHTSSDFHCNVCGVKYQYVPEQNLRAPEPNQISRTGIIITKRVPLSGKTSMSR